MNAASMDEISEIAAKPADISISVVSHGQIHLIESLLQDIAEHCRGLSLQLILTLNFEEALPFSPGRFSFPIEVIRNSTPLGFAANHNQAFAHATGQFFCVINPDIRFDKDPFPMLVEQLEDSSIGISAPMVLDENGIIEDSARVFPTPLKIICKAVGGCKGSDYPVNEEPIFPDWVGGMFMLFPRAVFQSMGGFNQRYFLYYEDVEICARLKLKGYKVVMCPAARVTHCARRSSHHDFRYFKWHFTSMTRFFCSGLFLKILWQKYVKGEN
jgi:GT2 family glycosyltransferase